MNARVIWDLADEPDGNVQHLLEHGVSIEEAEEVLFDPRSIHGVSRSSGRPLVFGQMAAGRHLAVVFEEVADDPPTIRPITAYDTPPSSKKPRKKR